MALLACCHCHCYHQIEPQQKQKPSDSTLRPSSISSCSYHSPSFLEATTMRSSRSECRQRQQPRPPSRRQTQWIGDWASWCWNWMITCFCDGVPLFLFPKWGTMAKPKKKRSQEWWSVTLVLRSGQESSPCSPPPPPPTTLLPPSPPSSTRPRSRVFFTIDSSSSNSSLNCTTKQWQKYQ